MDKRNILPQLGQPVIRMTAGKFSSRQLVELHEESLGDDGVGASASASICAFDGAEASASASICAFDGAEASASASICAFDGAEASASASICAFDAE